MADFVLRITSGPMAGQIIPLDNEFSVGRAETGHGNLGDDSQLSRHHARFRRLDTGQVLVEDLGSTNGTHVNGERIAAPRILAPGDTVTFGRTSLEFHADSPAGTDAARTAGAAPAPGAAPPAAAVPAAAAAAGAGFQAPPAAAAGPAGAAAPYGQPLHPSVQAGGIRARMIAAIGLLVLLIAGAVVAIVAATSSGKDKTACDPKIQTPRTRSGPGHFIFQTSACENASDTVATLRLHKGTSHGKTVWFVMTDSSDKAFAAKNGINFAPKLKNAIGSPAVQTVTMNNGVIDFPATVDFNHKRVLVAGPTDFPPSKAEPPAVGEPNYSPLIKLPNGIVVNASQVANDTGQADKVVSLDKSGGKVKYLITEGRYERKHIHYMSFDAGSTTSAAIEDVTFAPAMNNVPTVGDENINTSARENLSAFVNGPVGVNNPERQGLNSTIRDKMDPHNILHEVPELPHHGDVGSTDYAPMWDVHLVKWTPDAVSGGTRVEIGVTDDVIALAAKQPMNMPPLVTAPDGGRVRASGFDVNCPLLSIDIP